MTDTKICIIGGGNIGTTLAADLAHLDRNYHIRLLTSKPEKFSHTIEVHDFCRNEIFSGKIDVISDKPINTVSDADVIFITHPSFLIEKLFKEIAPYVKSEALIGIIPGTGGCEFYWKKYLPANVTLFGFQRVPYITRVNTYGHSVNLTDRRRPHLVVGTPTDTSVEWLISEIQKLIDFPAISVPNYLAITLTPSNPILHTARVYDLFHEASPDTIYPENPKFYAEWTVRASETLLAMDAELQELCRSIEDLDLSSVISLKIHYESETPEALTKKMQSIVSLKDMTSPMRPAEGGFKPDLQSRYFIEDFPFGLCIIKGFCEIYQLKTPMIDTVLRWYEQLSGVEYFTNGRFEGRDLKNTAIPQNFGIMTPDDVISFYGKPEGICPHPTVNQHN